MTANYTQAIKKGYMSKDSAPDLSFTGCYIKKYPNRTKDLDTFKAVIGRNSIRWQDLTERTLKEYRDSVMERVTANTARTIFARIKSVLNDMRGEVNLPTNRYAEILKAKQEPSQSVFLTESEVAMLEGVEPKDEKEKYVKCIYLMEVYCGARHSDILSLTEDNIKTVYDADGNERRYISYVSQKTSIQADIPLHRNFLNCMRGYDKNMTMYDYEFNTILRELCKRAGINERTKIYRRGEWQEGEKWEFVTTHVGRKSFCSELYLRGVDSRTISKMAGHSNSQMTEQRYIIPMRSLSDKAMAFFN